MKARPWRELGLFPFVAISYTLYGRIKSMENSEDKTVGRPKIEGLVQKAVHFDEVDLAAFTAHYKGRLLPDGTKDSVSAALRRLMRADLERIENEAIIAQARAHKGTS